MSLAGKIIRLRKKNGWSQEELADKMDISRQAVSKWESGQSIPDLDKILQLSELFCVTTDYLLKNEIEEEDHTGVLINTAVKKITMEEACTFIEQRKSDSWRIAFATFLCILSPIALIVLGMLSQLPDPIISETAAGAVGLIVLFIFVLCAVPLYIYCGFKNESYAFLDKNIPFELEYGVKGMLDERKMKFRSTYIKCNIIATCICIFSPIPLIISAFTGNELFMTVMLALLIIVAGIGACIFIVVGIQNASMQKLLQECDFAPEEKRRSYIKDAVGSAYWGVLTAIFLIWSFKTNQWHISWLVFAIGGVLFPVVICICDLISDKLKNN